MTDSQLTVYPIGDGPEGHARLGGYYAHKVRRWFDRCECGWAESGPTADGSASHAEHAALTPVPSRHRTENNDE